MAQPTILLELTIDGTKLEGEPSAGFTNPDKLIECLSYEGSVIRAGGEQPGMAASLPEYSSVQISKRVDGTSVEIWKALAENSTVDSAVFNFYKPNPTGTGSKLWYKITLEKARIMGVQFSLSSGGLGDEIPLEVVDIDFAKISQSHEIAGKEHVDDFADRVVG